jgi:BMFP domain-containing protein YqiC
MQSQNRILDEIAKLMTSAAGAAKGLREEVETLIRAQAERMISQMDLVPREEFDVVKAMASRARVDTEKLEKRLAALEASMKPKPVKQRTTINRPRRATLTRTKRRRV